MKRLFIGITVMLITTIAFAKEPNGFISTSDNTVRYEVWESELDHSIFDKMELEATPSKEPRGDGDYMLTETKIKNDLICIRHTMIYSDGINEPQGTKCILNFRIN